MAISFSPDGAHLVSGYVNGRLTLWVAADGLKLSSVLAHDQSIDACVFSPDGATILTASGDSTLKLWDVA